MPETNNNPDAHAQPGLECEEWRPVLEYEGFYEVSSLGRVRSVDRFVAHPHRGFSLKKGRVLCQRVIRRHGRCDVSLSKFGKISTGSVQSLVCEAFHGPRPEGKVVAHWDGNKLNNRSSNVRWATHKENEQDKARHGRVARGIKSGHYTKPERTPRGEAANKSHLTEKDIVEIRSSPMGCLRLSRQYSISSQTIKCIRRRLTWTHIP